MARWDVTRDGTAVLGTTNNVSRGQGKCKHLDAGYSQGWRARSFAYAQAAWPAATYQHKKTVLWLKTSAFHFTPGANARILVQLIDVNWQAGFFDGDGEFTAWADTNLLGWDNQPAVRFQKVWRDVPNTGGVVFGVDVTALIDRIVPATILDSTGQPGAGESWFGLRIAAGDSGGALRDSEGDGPFSFEVLSSEGAYTPWFEVTIDTNHPPNAPNNVTPADGDVVGSTSGTEVTVRAEFSDFNVEDSITKSHVQFWQASTVDPVVPGEPPTGGTLLAESLKDQTTALHTHKQTGLPARTAMRFRIQDKDDQGAWGAWSLLSDGGVTTATAPSAPEILAIDTTTLTPALTLGLATTDPADYVTKAQWLIYDDSIPGSQPIYDRTFDIAGTSTVRPVLTYDGNTLREDVAYRSQAWLWNRDDIQSPSTGDFRFTLHIPTGPTISPGNTGTKQNDTTPDFTLTFGFTADQYEFEVWFIPTEPRQIVEEVPDGATQFYDVPPTLLATPATTAVVTPTKALTNGTVFHVRAAGRPDGSATMGPWSPLYPVYINALPDAPVVTFTNGVEKADGTWVVPNTTTAMTIEAPFTDADQVRYVEAATEKRTEVRVANATIGTGSHVTGSPKVITSAIADSELWNTGLTLEASYDVAVKYRDNSGTYGPLSEWVTVKLSQPPVIGLTAPGDNALTADPTPTLDWTFTSPGGKTQQRKRVRLYRQIPG